MNNSYKQLQENYETALDTIADQEMELRELKQELDDYGILKRAKEQCEYLIVGVTTDRLCYERKKKYPIICEADRMAIVKELKCVDEVVSQDNMDKVAAAKKYHADAVFVGSDWKGTESWNKYEEELAQIGCTVVYLNHTDGISSTILRNRLNRGEKAL